MPPTSSSTPLGIGSNHVHGRSAPPAGRRLVVAGSCSEQTRAQVAHFRGPSFRVTPGDVAGALAFLSSTDATALVYTSAAPDQVVPGAAHEIEETLATIARHAVADLDVGQLVVAGGETSGAVCQALGLRALDVREHVGPGLAWCSPRPDPGLRVLLKSGNFGDDDLFEEAWL